VTSEAYYKAFRAAAVLLLGVEFIDKILPLRISWNFAMVLIYLYREKSNPPTIIILDTEKIMSKYLVITKLS
jgi:hypothetical protein